MAKQFFGDVDEIRVLLDKTDHKISFTGIAACYIKKGEDKKILICEPPF